MADSVTQAYTADEILSGITAALRERNMPAVASLLCMLAVVDPESAEWIHEMIKLRQRVRKVKL